MKRRTFVKNCMVTGVSGLVLAHFGAAAGNILLDKLQGKDQNNHKLPLRPPGALPEPEFLSRCIRCLRCVNACPNNAIQVLDDSFGPQSRNTPGIKPRRQSCMLCNLMEGDHLKCTKICPTGALQPIRKELDDIRAKVRMGTAQIDEALCYSYNNWSCGACYRACPLAGVAMKLGMWEKPEVAPDACVGCGACERACIRYPQAIRIKPRDSQ